MTHGGRGRGPRSRPGDTTTTSNIAGITRFSWRNFRRRKMDARQCGDRPTAGRQRVANTIFIAGILARQIATISSGEKIVLGCSSYTPVTLILVPTLNCTVCGHRMAHRKWKETKQQPSLLPGPAVPGCSLVSFHFLWAILCPQAVQCE